MIMPLPLLLAVLGAVFCAWSASGNSLNFCVTAGCMLFQDFTVAGVSMWWFGSGAFVLLAILALAGRPWLGVLAGAFCVLADVILLSIMLVTAPCVGCLFAALLFALCYATFRQSSGRRGQAPTRSWLLPIWGLLFVVNIGAIIRAEVSTWAIAGPEDATVRVYFSPSCSACREAITALSGRVNVAFYPIEENGDDVNAIVAMAAALEKGASVADALTAGKAEQPLSIWKSYSPDMLLLRFRLLRNKAHVMAAGSQTVPFIEYQGMPAGLSQKSGSRNTAREATAPKDATLPLDGEIAGSCGGPANAPCP